MLSNLAYHAAELGGWSDVAKMFRVPATNERPQLLYQSHNSYSDIVYNRQNNHLINDNIKIIKAVVLGPVPGPSLWFICYSCGSLAMIPGAAAVVP